VRHYSRSSERESLREVFERLQDYAPGEFVLEQDDRTYQPSSILRSKRDKSIGFSVGHHAKIGRVLCLSMPYGLRLHGRHTRYANFKLWADGYFEVPRAVKLAREAVVAHEPRRLELEQQEREKVARDAKIEQVKAALKSALAGHGIAPGKDGDTEHVDFDVRPDGVSARIGGHYPHYDDLMSPEDAAALAAFVEKLPSLQRREDGNEKAA
jgi:hypothetical protein